MVSAPSTAPAASGLGQQNINASSRSSPAVGSGTTTNGAPTAKAKGKVNSNGYHPPNTHTPLSSLVSTALDLTSVERRGQPTAVREPIKKKSRPHGIEEAPTYTPTEEEWRDPLEYLNKIYAEASKYGICKIIPPESWNPDFAIDTERFHFRTRKQELNSVEGSTRANLSYLDGLMKFHKQQGNALQRFPYVDKKPLDLYRLKKAVESRGGFDKVCKLKKWAEIGRDLGYSGKIMSSLSTSLKNSFQRWLCPYEEYLRIAKPGVHQQLEAEYGGPLTPSPAPTPVKRSTVNTPSSMRANSPSRNASSALHTSFNGKGEADGDVSMTDAAPAPTPAPTSGFTAVNTGGFTAVNSGFTSVNRPVNREASVFTPDSKRVEHSASVKNTPESRTPGLGSAAALKRTASADCAVEAIKKDLEIAKDDGENSGRRSKRIKKDNVPTVAGSHMSVFRPSVPRIPRDENASIGEKCGTCGRGEDAETLFVCDSCDHAYHGQCVDPPLKRRPEGEWNCPRCLVGDGQFGFEEGGLYSLKQFQQKANDFKQGYFETKMPFDDTLKCHRPVTEEDVEKEFWRLVADLEETVEVEYGADIHCTTHGSGFPTLEKHPNNPYAADPWNLNILPFHPESLFRHIKSDISGMTVPWVYVGMIFSTFCWHNEDHYAYSANYQHFGATKTWYGIPGEDAEKFEAAMKEAVPELFETQPDLLFQLVTLLTPEHLRKAGVRVYALDQRAGQFVFTFPQAYHAGFNHGFNFNEAVNFAPHDWEAFGLAGVERLQTFRRQPCFSHDELLWTAAEGSASSGLSIQTAKWLAPALERIHSRELAQRGDFRAKHLDSLPHSCSIFSDGEDSCPLTFETSDEDVQDEDEQCCSYCKAFAFLSRFKCIQTGKVMCMLHAGSHACCELSETQRFSGEGHVLIHRKRDEAIHATYNKVIEKARQPEIWQEKYEKLLEEEAQPSLKALRTLVHEGDRIPFDLPALPNLKEFVDRCNEWVEEATSFIVRKQQVRRKNERSWGSGRRSNAGQRDRETRSAADLNRLLQDAEHIGFECPEIGQLQERAATVKEFQAKAQRALENSASVPSETIEELMEEGRNFNIEIPELNNLSRVLDQMQWNNKAKANRGVPMSLQEVEDLIEEGKSLQIPRYNDLLQHYREQLSAGEAWEKKAKELIHAELVHYPQLDALATQVKANALPVSRDTYASVEAILHKQREAHRQILDLTNRCQDPNYRNRPSYLTVLDLCKRLEDLNSKPNGTIDLENERKRHEDWMRKGKKLFGKSNAPLHILKSHLEYVLERNMDCFDVENDTPRQPAEPVSREASPDNGGPRWDTSRPKQVFCICRKIEAGMMIECELCHEWYHCKCLKIARGKVKEDDKYTCPICDYRMRIPRDAARPKLEDLIALVDEIPLLPFQPEEEELLRKIIENAEQFRQKIAPYCNPLLSTEAEIETQRFYLRKIEGAEVLLAFETNFFRQELHKWCPVAPQAPPILEVSLSTRKPRPTKLQKMLAEYGVDNPDDLPEHAKGKANSLRRKAANAEAAAAAASSSGPILPPSGTAAYGAQAFFPPSSKTDSFINEMPFGSGSPEEHGNRMNIDSNFHPSLSGPGPQLIPEDSSMSLEERILRQEDVDIHTEADKSKALDILRRTEDGRQTAERLWGPDIWETGRRSNSDHGRSITPANIDPMMKEDDGNVDQMFKEMTNQDDDDERRKDIPIDTNLTAASLETERNGMDALLDRD